MNPEVTPSVSIVVCVYNGERFLHAALNSAFTQTYSDFELIAVDDGSTDGSALLLANCSDPRVRYIRTENQGAAIALERGVRESRGEFIAMLDQDDLWAPEKLAMHVDLLRQRPEIDLTFSWFRMINDAGNEIGLHSNRYRGTIDFRSLLADFVIGASSNVVMRRSAVERAGGPDRDLPRLYDMDLCLRIAMLAPHNTIAICRDLMFYRRHPVQITRDIQSLETEWEQAYRKWQRLASADVAAAGNRARSNMNRFFACLAYEEGSYRRGLTFLRSAFQCSPGSFLADSRNWRAAAACMSGVILPQRLCRKLERLAGLKRW
jgi:glycosyltransferase involved in cell wall biosynthesis